MRLIEDVNMYRVGDNIRHLRKDLNLTQKELAEVVGLTQAQISDYERGRRSPSLRTLDKLLIFFKGN